MMSVFQAWLREQAGPEAVSMIRPGEEPGPGISIVLNRLERGENPRTDGARTLDALLMIVVGGPDAAANATLCGEVMFALHDERWIDDDGVVRPLRLESGQAADGARLSLGLPPCHCLLVRLPLRRERPRDLVQPVRQPMKLSTEDMGVLDGIVVGQIAGSAPQPLADVRIEAPEYGRISTSDRRGRFRISGLPSRGPIALAIFAKGQSHSMSIEDRSGEVVLRVPID
jgi:hypothetical protein